MTGVCATASVLGYLRSAFEAITAVRSRSLRAFFCNLCNKWQIGVQSCIAALCPFKYISRFEYKVPELQTQPRRPQEIKSNAVVLVQFTLSDRLCYNLTTIQNMSPNVPWQISHLCHSFLCSRIRLCTNFLNSKLECIHNWRGGGGGAYIQAFRLKSKRMWT